MSALNKLASLLGLFDGGIPFSNRNYIVDGNMDFASGGVVSINSNYGAHPLFLHTKGTGGTQTTQGVNMGAAEPAGLTTPARNALVITQSVAASDSPSVVHRVESVLTLHKRSATFSCWLWVASGSITIPKISAAQFFGTGGSTTVSFDKTVNWVVTTTPQRFSVRLDVPSVTGKTLGANDMLQVGLLLPSGVSFTLTTTQWQLEASSKLSSSDINGNGGAPTAYEHRGYMAEQDRLQRFYQGQCKTRYATGGSGTAGAYVGGVRPFLVQMRTAPAVSTTDMAGNPGKITTANQGDNRSPTGGSILAGIDPRFIETDILINQPTEGNWISFYFTADARY